MLRFCDQWILPREGWEMEVTISVINAAVVAAVGLILGWIGKGRFDALERRMEQFQGSLDSMRSDLTQVALAVGARPGAENA
jgi:hypothetical protein